MQVTARVPTRIDLAGATLDVYPLYLFEDGGLTVNAALDVYASASAVTRSDERIDIVSEDLGDAVSFPSLDDMPFGEPLDLVRRVLHYYRPNEGVTVRVRSEAPKGSGIGASSALLMALSHCLNSLTERGLTHQQIIDIGANLEAQVIGIPTGKQDYFPPIFGGVCAMWFDVDGWRFESLSEGRDLVEQLDECLVVSYTGIPHSSAVTNWAMLKSYIEKQGDSVARMREIKAIASEMRACLVSGSMSEFARLVDAEWQLRRGLAEGVTTPEVDEMMAAATRAGAMANKICGAGGGGCMITVIDPDARKSVCSAIEAAGARVLDAHITRDGLCLKRSPD